MAVIITNMDIPTGCSNCFFNTKEKIEICALAQQYIPKSFKTNDILYSCPLKSTDEILDVIVNHKLSDDELIDLDEDSILWGLKIAYDRVDKYCKGDSDVRKSD